MDETTKILTCDFLLGWLAQHEFPPIALELGREIVERLRSVVVVKGSECAAVLGFRPRHPLAIVGHGDCYFVNGLDCRLLVERIEPRLNGRIRRGQLYRRGFGWWWKQRHDRGWLGTLIRLIGVPHPGPYDDGEFVHVTVIIKRVFGLVVELKRKKTLASRRWTGRSDADENDIPGAV